MSVSLVSDVGSQLFHSINCTFKKENTAPDTVIRLFKRNYLLTLHKKIKTHVFAVGV